MSDSRLWSTPEPEPQLVEGWRPERPDLPRGAAAPDPPPAAAVPRPSPPPAEGEAVDVAAAAERVRRFRSGERSEDSADPADPADAAPRVRRTADPADAPTLVMAQERTHDLAAAADRVRAREQAAGTASGFSGSGFDARRRPAPAVPGAPPPRRWLAPVLSALVGALVVVVIFLLLTGGDGVTDDNAQAPLPATKGGGGTNIDARAIYARAADSVVSVISQMPSGRATGTGFLARNSTTIVTNAHVVGSAKTVEVQFGDKGRTVNARVLGRDVSSDLAVLHIPNQSTSARALPIADSDGVRVGDGVVAIGNPFGLSRTATAGIVSATGRHITAPNGFDIDGVIQTDAPINPGNSGGPLLDARGRVIGVNSQIATASGGGGNVGIGFAVPSNTLRDVVPRLQQGKKINRPFLGVSTTTDARGARVVTVVPSGPADAAGIRVDDVIIGIGGHRITTPDEVATAIGNAKTGDTVEIEIIRGGVHQSIDVRLGTRPGG
ncbi:MAG: trypsin-like peptidase domain-containing protein [Solirubrobacteraceae bacterium]